MATTPLNMGQGRIRQIVSPPPTLDTNLPTWARRTNPIIRRQLGIYWRVFVPQVDLLLRWYVYQAILIVLTAQFSFLFAPILMLVLASVLLLPIAFWMYARLISEIVADSVRSITDEFKNDTLMLLRVTPFTLQHIVLSKVAASFWRQMEALDGVLSLSLFLGTPLILFMQVLRFPPETHLLTPQLFTIAVMLVSLLRLPLEMFMVGMLGMASGTAGRTKSTGVIITSTLTFFYFLLINLPRFLDLPMPLYFLVEIVLPLLLPCIIIWLCLRLTMTLLVQD
ncbi:MAG: hypothetical protein SF029_08805 [bacterium]|nr:hypothetical protein [bacterium]